MSPVCPGRGTASGWAGAAWETAADSQERSLEAPARRRPRSAPLGQGRGRAAPPAGSGSAGRAPLIPALRRDAGWDLLWPFLALKGNKLDLEHEERVGCVQGRRLP